MKCPYSNAEHTPIENEEGGFIYCAECGELLKIIHKEKAKRWFKEVGV